MGGHKKPLIVGPVAGIIAAYLPAHTRHGQAALDPVDGGAGAGDIAAGGRDAAAGVLDEGADQHVRPIGAGFIGLGKFSIAIVHHDKRGGFFLPDRLENWRHFLGKQGVAPGIAPERCK